MCKLLHKALFLPILGFLSVALSTNLHAISATYYDAPEGYAALNGGTTGGAGGSIVTPKTVAELKTYAESDDPYIILLTQEFTGPNVIEVGSNTSLIGMGSSAFINMIGLKIQCKQNIIIRNIKFTMTGVEVDNSSGENKIVGFNFDPDCIAIQADDENLDEADRITRNIWIDHCEFYNEDPSVMTDYDRYDGLVDVKNDAQYITMSWNYFHDHHKACLSGKGASDKYDRKTTMAFNRFENIKSRLPLFRYGSLHFVNNYLNDCPEGNGINVRVAAQAYVDRNYFNNVKKPIFGKIGETGGDGAAHLVGNKWVDCSRLPAAIMAISNDSPGADALSASEEFGDCSYVPEYNMTTSYAVNDVPSNVTAYSGVGVLEFSINGNTAPSVTITSPTTNSYIAPASLTISATATDDDGTVAKVAFYNGTTLLGEDTSSPYSYNWDAIAAGSYTIIVKATDDDGAIGSASYAITVADTSSIIDTTTTDTTTTDTTVFIDGDVVHNFTTNGTASAFFSITGNLSTSKGTVMNGTDVLTQCLKMESSTSIIFTTTNVTTITLVFNDDFNGAIKIDGVDCTVTNGRLTMDLVAGNHTISKGDSSNLYYMALAYDDITGISATAELDVKELKMFPNPMRSNGSIVYNGESEGVYTLSVYYGKYAVAERRLSGSKGVLSWSALGLNSAGMYTVLLTCDGETIAVKQVYLPQ